MGQNAWINEFHYDNTGTDANEFIEVVVENPSGFTLSLFQVVLYNGADGLTYNSKSLSTYTLGSTSGNFSIYYLNYTATGGSIQNGAPDGIALIYNGLLIPGQFLSYEGTFTALNGPANGSVSTNIGVSEDPAPAAGLSLQLSGTGTHYADFSWQAPATATMGTLNTGQSLGAPAPSNPSNFDAASFSESQVNISWSLNNNANDIMLAWNSTNNFGTPTGTYAPGNSITGGGTVLYTGISTAFSHVGLNGGTQYYYKAWSVNASNSYSSGVIDSAFTRFPEPSGHPAGLLAACNGTSWITVSWTDSDADHYLVKGSSTGYSSIVFPVDGTAEPNSRFVKNADAAVEQQQFTGLAPNTQYFFKIFPYNGLGSAVNYKLDGTIPQASAVTDSVRLKLLISEVADPVQSNCRFVELYNAGTTTIDFSLDSVYFCRQTNGSPSSWGSLLLTGTLAAGQSYIIAYLNSYFDTAYSQTADKYSTLVNNNGNDGVFLYYGGNQSTGYRFDSYGQIDVNGDTTAWQYTDGHAVRKRSISSASRNWNANEWVVIKDLNYKNMTPDVHAASTTWLGSGSSDWNARGSNWSGLHGFVPDASYIVTIPNSTTDPLVTTASACQQVILQSGAVLEIQSIGSLQIVGK
jgi:hypothetical protein